MIKKILGFLVVCSLPTYASISIDLDAGELTGPNGVTTGPTAMMSNSLLLLVAADGDSTFSTNLSAGSFVSGNDLVLGAAGFNTAGGTNETLNFIVVSATDNNPSDQLALYWFPQITLAEYQSGTLLTAGQYYGVYNPDGGGSTTNGGANWLLPSPGSTISLDMYTSNSDGGGNLAPSAGYAENVVSNVGSSFTAPEPSTWNLMGFGIVLLSFTRWRLLLKTCDRPWKIGPRRA